MFYTQNLTWRRPGSQELEHAEFPTTITTGCKPGQLLQLDGSSITSAAGGLPAAKWKLGDGSNGRIYLATREVLDNTYTEVPLDRHVFQNEFQTPQILGEVLTGVAAAGLMEIEGVADYLKIDAGDGQVGAAESINAELCAVGGKLLIKEGTHATKATVAYVRGYVPPADAANPFRILVEFVGGVTDHDAT